MYITCYIFQVIDILLSVEKVPLSVSTSRKAIILISRLQMGISSAKIHKDYLPLLLHGIIGILHNRFCNLWDPAVDCLSVLIGKYKELIWDRFVQFFGNYQSKFLSSCDQLVKLHPEYPKQNGRDNFFIFFNMSLAVIVQSRMQLYLMMIDQCIPFCVCVCVF